MRNKLMAGAAILALLMNSPQVKAEDEIIIFGGEFEDSEKKVKPQKPEEPKPQETSSAPLDDDDNWGDKLVFDDLSNAPEQKPIEQPVAEPPQEITKPIEQPVAEPPQEITKPIEQPVAESPQEITKPIEQPEPQLQPTEYDKPFAQASEISNEWQESVEQPIAVLPTPAQIQEKSAVRSAPRTVQPQTTLKMLKPRFIKLAVDDTYIYYLDKNTIKWEKMPYSSSEYIADVWIRMVEREPKQLDDDMAAYSADNFKAQIDLAREQGYQYPPEDIKVLRQQNYVLEHYYLRPKTRQVQFLCELEVFGRPQNTINERAYDYKNWENLVPGSVESTIYDAAIKILGKSKASERGHMTFIDMLDEYARIALN